MGEARLAFDLNGSMGAHCRSGDVSITRLMLFLEWYDLLEDRFKERDLAGGSGEFGWWERRRHVSTLLGSKPGECC